MAVSSQTATGNLLARKAKGEGYISGWSYAVDGKLAADKNLPKSKTNLALDHPERGRYLTVGCPIKLSESPAEIEPAPLLGEHSQQILRPFSNIAMTR